MRGGESEDVEIVESILHFKSIRVCALPVSKYVVFENLHIRVHRADIAQGNFVHAFSKSCSVHARHVQWLYIR